LGETGTGKGYFAAVLHRAGDRRDKPFVVVNCAGLPPNLIESELFGREKGAFTGSTTRQIGRFELANGGTIFLDEIGELPIELQAKLLKVIEDEVFERLGSPHPVKVDVRIIASTNRNLEEEIRKGQFRKDLYYRLNVFPITIPPLKQRKEDIAPLAEYFLAGFGRKLGKRITTIPGSTLLILENYPWPGNVREMSNVIERSVIMSKGPELELVDLPDPSTTLPENGEAPAVPETSANKSLQEVERDHIIKTLQETGWKISGADGAAQHLGLHSNTLRARMQKLGVKRPRIH
jgi:transcriptional regulator with GAF, ATPase, and Fis domain